MNREQKIKFCQDSAEEFGIAIAKPFEEMTAEELEKEYEWYDYLWDK
ncbi:hypothetical protein ACS2BX_25660 [Bacillus cereus group sp. BceL300]